MGERTQTRLGLLVALAVTAVAAGCGIREHNYHPIIGTDPPLDPGNPDPAAAPAAARAAPAAAAATPAPEREDPPARAARARAAAAAARAAAGAAAVAAGSGAGGSGGGSTSPDARTGTPDMTAAPAGSINIAGTVVPKEKAIVILHFGHSNMLGHGATPEGLRPFFFSPQPRLWAYRGNGNFVQAVEPTFFRRSFAQHGRAGHGPVAGGGGARPPGRSLHLHRPGRGIGHHPGLVQGRACITATW